MEFTCGVGPSQATQLCASGSRKQSWCCKAMSTPTLKEQMKNALSVTVETEAQGLAVAVKELNPFWDVKVNKQKMCQKSTKRTPALASICTGSAHGRRDAFEPWRSGCHSGGGGCVGEGAMVESTEVSRGLEESLAEIPDCSKEGFLSAGRTTCIPLLTELWGRNGSFL